MAPRFLGSAFAAGPALLILICMFLRKYTKFDAGWEAIQTLSKIVTYAMIISVFFVVCELFTVFYSQIPEHMNHFTYIFWVCMVTATWCRGCGRRQSLRLLLSLFW